LYESGAGLLEATGVIFAAGRVTEATVKGADIVTISEP
jgi:hypothetical protein